MTYPFEPKSSAKLRPGDFWPIPLADGSFACGRVLQLAPKGMAGGRVQFFGALMDWRRPAAPTFDDLGGARSLEQGAMHIHSITRIGRAVVGHRPLELDGVQPWLFVNGNAVQKGYERVRAWRPSDTADLPAFTWWGWNVIWLLANKRLLGVDLPPSAMPSA